MRTGRFSSQAAMAVRGWTDRSSLPPKPPPTEVGMIRTSVTGMPRIRSDLVAVHVGGLGAGDDFDAVADAACGVRSRPRGFYRPGVFDEAGGDGDGSFGGGIGGGPRRRPAVLTAAAAKRCCAGGVGMQVGGRAGVVEGYFWQRVPGNRKIGVSDTGQGFGVADQGADGFAAVADMGLGQDGLVLAGGVDAVEVAAGDVGGGQDADQAGVGGIDRGEIAEGETGVGVRAADRAQGEGWFVGQRVGAEPVGADEFGGAVDLGEAAADRVVAGWGRWGGDVEHGVDDLAVAGAAAQHTAERVLHRLVGRRGVARQKIGGGHQHAGGAEATLGRAVAEECVLERIQGGVAGRRVIRGGGITRSRWNHAPSSNELGRVP